MGKLRGLWRLSAGVGFLYNRPLDMRILYLIDRFHLGGSEESATCLAVEQARRGHRCFVAAVRPPPDDDNVGRNQKRRLSSTGIGHTTLCRRSARFDLLYAPLSLIALIKKFRPHLIHVHTDIPDLVAAVALRLKRFPVVRTIHNTSLWATHRGIGRFVETTFRAAAVVTVSNDALDAYHELRSRYSLDISTHREVILEGCAVDFEPYGVARTGLAERFGADTNKTLFCFAGRSDEQKGFDILIDAMSRLPQEHMARCELHMFSEPAAADIFRRCIGDRDLPIRLHAPVAGIARLFPGFDAVLVPSRWEGLGRVSVESFAAGTPVLATEVPGLRETLPPGWPLIAPARDAVAFSELLVDFLEGRALTPERLTEARNWVLRKFSLSRAADRYEQVYRQACARAAPI